MFPEDGDIRVSMLVKLWVAEGLIKPGQDKCLEQTAHGYLEDLISRNLVLVGERGSRGNVKSCKLHDVVRDLCIAQAEKEKFAVIAKLDNYVSPNINETARRLSISTRKRLRRTIEAVESASLIRSLLSHQDELMFDAKTMKSFRLLKVVHGGDYNFMLINLTNLRYVFSYSIPSFPSMALCWNLHSLLLPGAIMSDLPPEIWLMPQLRHLKMHSFNLPEPPDGDHNVIVLENLLTIKGVKDFKCSEHVLKRIPNLKKLGAVYDSKTSGAHEQAAKLCLHNVARLEKLESLKLYGAENVWPTIAFPISLKKLKLNGCCLHWEDLSVVGSLPNLEVLMLGSCAILGEKWNPIDEQFRRLKFLAVESCNLKIWGAENCHFPCLERLFLKHVPLETIPVSFSDILTLEQIYLEDVNDSVRASAREISDERVELGYEPLRLRLY